MLAEYSIEWWAPSNGAVISEASLIDTHRLLVIGGSDGGSDLDTTELLDVFLGVAKNMFTISRTKKEGMVYIQNARFEI